ncbi:MAG TPA: HNH endonuclease signature motif containing protein [Noviherbaspirillum sp.]|nr:HNH endonuclease signature motif containing protein [Noviherbaspirillum sp.]
MAPSIRAPRKKKEDNGRTLALGNAPWRKLRALVLNDDPFCRHCGQPATDVDHINNDPSDNRLENLQPLCHSCHSHKTNVDMGHRVAYGCDVNGMPLDPSHPWNLEKSPEAEPHKPTGSPHANANRENEP